MTAFAYNNAKNASTGYMLFELNCGYHPRVSYKENLNSRSQSKTVEKLSSELQNLMAAYQKIPHHAQNPQKQAHNKGVKLQSYATGKKVWLNSKCLNTKPNCKLEAKFLGLFWVLHPVGKQTYKHELPKKWRIYDVFHISLLEEDITKKGQRNDTQLNFKFEAGNNKEYEVDGIQNSAVYAKESASRLPGLYYLVL